MKFSENELVEKLNSYLAKGYEGYVQFSGCKIDNDCIFEKGNSTIPENKEGFIFESHLCNDKESITVRRINKDWYLDETDISVSDNSIVIDTKSFLAQHGRSVKMAQIWQAEEDEFCEDMEVMKLKKVVFAGFEKSEGSKS